MRHHSKHEDGFTLMELMVVIAIIAILATLAAPSFRTQIQKSQVSNEMRGLSNAIQESRSQALLLRRNYPLTITPTPDASSGTQFEMTDVAATWRPDSSKVTVVSTPATTNMNFTLMGGVGNDLCFSMVHANNNAIGQVLRVSANGSSTIHKDTTAC